VAVSAVATGGAAPSVSPRAHPTWLIPALSKTISALETVLPQVSCHRALAAHSNFAGLKNSSARLTGFVYGFGDAVQVAPA
jgi:hypothetical protein